MNILLMSVQNSYAKQELRLFFPLYQWHANKSKEEHIKVRQHILERKRKRWNINHKSNVDSSQGFAQ